MYQAALERAPDDWRLHCGLGELASASGQFRLALEHLKIVAEDAYGKLLCATNLARPRKAADESMRRSTIFARPRRWIPLCLAAYSNLGLMLSRRGQDRRGHRRISKVAEDRCRNMPWPIISIGVAFSQCGRLDEAVAHYQGPEIDPTLACPTSTLQIF